MRKLLGRSAMVITVLLGGAWVVFAGGWSIITFNQFPDYAVTGTPLTLTFAVRQHGIHLVSGLKPTIRASSTGGLEVVATATPTSNAGEYSATLSLDSPGEWTLRADGGFNPNDKSRQHNSVVLPPLPVVRDASAAPDFSEADRGRRLAVTKGCIGCHAPGSDRDITRKRLATDDLKAFLADPSGRKVEMPNLALTETEIAALSAYISRSRRSSVGVNQQAEGR